MARRWNPSLHPRGADGKFVHKRGTTAFSARVGLRSASLGASYTHPLPRNYQVHISTVARIEKVDAQTTYLQRLTTAALLKIVDQLPNARLQNIARRAIQERQLAGPRGVAINLPARQRTRASAVRLRKVTGAGKSVTAGSRARTARRPRQPRSRRVR